MAKEPVSTVLEKQFQEFCNIVREVNQHEDGLSPAQRRKWQARAKVLTLLLK